MRDLIEAAKPARLKAHAPYSKFLVGAAVRDEQGRVHAGCNIENAAYPQGWCAEPSAICRPDHGGRQADHRSGGHGQWRPALHALRRLPPEDPGIRAGRCEDPLLHRGRAT